MSKNPFTEADQQKIKEAVAAAEKTTAGEIVTYYVEASDGYQETIWRGGILATLLGILTMGGFTRYYGDWMPLGLFEVLAIIICSLFVGIGLAYIPLLKRLLAGKELIGRRVDARAMEAFLTEEVFDTSDRTGILLFMSMFERRVVVMGDTGINAKVDQSSWNEVVDLIKEGMKDGKPTDGLVDAIGKCGQLLHIKGVAIKEDDENELSDGIRIGN